MQRSSIFIILAVALGLELQPAMGLGLGKTLETATLGSPLNFAVALTTDGDDTAVDSRCVKAVVVVGERTLQAGDVEVRLERVQASGERRIRVLTTQPMDEPVVTVTLQVGCPARFTRSFVVFADPPTVVPQVALQDAPTTDASSVTIERPRSDWDGLVPRERAVAPKSAGASARRGSGKAVSARGAQGSASTRHADKSTTARPRPAAKSTAVAKPRLAPAPVAAATTAAASQPQRGAMSMGLAAKPPAVKGAVLQLDPGTDFETPPLRLSRELSAPNPALAAAAAASAAQDDADAAQRQKDEAQLVALEQAVRQLQDDYRTKQKAFIEMTARNNLVNSRPDGRLVYPLAAISGLLVVAVGALLWLRRRDRQRAGWWSASSMLWPAGAEAAPSSQDAHPALSVFLAPDNDDGPRLPPESVRHRVEVPLAEPRSDTGTVRQDPLLHKDSGFDDAQQSGASRRAMTAEELIDLEQQVDFFVALGQDEAAIDLMMGHVRNTGGSSPLPYLKLLEIYRRRDEREPYDRIRERFNRRFNAHAPSWGVDPESGKSLEDYPEVMSRLESAWSSPSSAVALLDVLLFKRDAGPTFDVPAYRSLVFLYGIARELSGPDGAASTVDLLLPMDEAKRLSGDDGNLLDLSLDDLDLPPSARSGP